MRAAPYAPALEGPLPLDRRDAVLLEEHLARFGAGSRLMSVLIKAGRSSGRQSTYFIGDTVEGPSRTGHLLLPALVVGLASRPVARPASKGLETRKKRSVAHHRSLSGSEQSCTCRICRANDGDAR